MNPLSLFDSCCSSAGAFVWKHCVITRNANITDSSGMCLCHQIWNLFRGWFGCMLAGCLRFGSGKHVIKKELSRRTSRSLLKFFLRKNIYYQIWVLPRASKNDPRGISSQASKLMTLFHSISLGLPVPCQAELPDAEGWRIRASIAGATASQSLVAEGSADVIWFFFRFDRVLLGFMKACMTNTTVRMQQLFFVHQKGDIKRSYFIKPRPCPSCPTDQSWSGFSKFMHPRCHIWILPKYPKRSDRNCVS